MRTSRPVAFFLMLGLCLGTSLGAARTPANDPKKPPEKPAEKPATQPSGDGKVKVSAGDEKWESEWPL